MQQEQNQDFLNAFMSLIQNANKPKIQHSIKDCIKLWLDYSETRCRPDTIKYYKKEINIAFDYLKQEDCNFIEDVTFIKMNSVIATLKRSGKYKNNSINKIIECVKQLVHYCYMNDIIEYDQLSKLQKLQRDDVETITIKDEQIEKIFNYMGNLDLSNHINFRNVLFIHLLRDTGARYNEIRNILISDINLENNSILLRLTKTHEMRTVYITPTTKELIEKFIQDVKPKDYLMCNVKTKEMTVRCNLYSFIHKLKEECGITQSISPHKWRHTLATQLVKMNISLENVRKLLGHSTLNITKKYLHVDDESQRNTILNALQKIQGNEKKEDEN